MNRNQDIRACIRLALDVARMMIGDPDPAACAGGGDASDPVASEDPSSTDGLDDLTLRHLQLREIRKALGLRQTASHQGVLRAIFELHLNALPRLPRRYRDPYVEMLRNPYVETLRIHEGQP